MTALIIISSLIQSIRLILGIILIFQILVLILHLFGIENFRSEEGNYPYKETFSSAKVLPRFKRMLGVLFLIILLPSQQTFYLLMGNHALQSILGIFH